MTRLFGTAPRSMPSPSQTSENAFGDRLVTAVPAKVAAIMTTVGEPLVQSSATRRSWGPSWRRRRRREGSEDPWLCVASFCWLCLYREWDSAPLADVVNSGMYLNWSQSKADYLRPRSGRQQRLWPKPGAWLGSARIGQLANVFSLIPDSCTTHVEIRCLLTQVRENIVLLPF